MKEYTHVFFDLDHTLWDFETNSREALDEIFLEFELGNKRVRSAIDFIHVYERINHLMWDAYRKGEITKAHLRKERFPRALAAFDIYDDEMAERITEYYLEHSPQKTNLFDHAHNVLDYLSSKYDLFIITNGFEEIQDIKMDRSQLKPYFKEVITSEMVGVRKPDPKIFEHALTRAGSEASKSVMIGDDINADIHGAQAVGMTGIYFNPKEQTFEGSPHKEIYCLSELKELL